MIRFLHIGRRQSPVTTSALNSPLERVRDMRGHSDWEPLTNPSNIRERADRVAEARQKIEIPPLATEREPSEPESSYHRTLEFWRPMLITFAGLTGFAIVILVVFAFNLDFSTSEVTQASILFPSADTNLTQSVADRFARRAIVSAGADGDEWELLGSYHRIDGSVVVTFDHKEWFKHRTLSVIVSLERGNNRIVCTVNPQ